MSLFQCLGLDFGSRIFFYIIDMDQCLYDPCILLNSPKVKCKVDLPLLTGKVTNDVLDCNSFKALRVHSWRVYPYNLWSFEL